MTGSGYTWLIRPGWPSSSAFGPADLLEAMEKMVLGKSPVGCIMGRYTGSVAQGQGFSWPLDALGPSWSIS